MSETDFVFAWLLAAKSGSGIAVGWKASTIEAQLREAREVYNRIKQSAESGDPGGTKDSPDDRS